jgi:hypothetical protein
MGAISFLFYIILFFNEEKYYFVQNREHRRMSKVDTLRSAMEYIKELETLLGLGSEITEQHRSLPSSDDTRRSSLASIMMNAFTGDNPGNENSAKTPRGDLDFAEDSSCDEGGEWNLSSSSPITETGAAAAPSVAGSDKENGHRSFDADPVTSSPPFSFTDETMNKGYYDAIPRSTDDIEERYHSDLDEVNKLDLTDGASERQNQQSHVFLDSQNNVALLPSFQQIGGLYADAWALHTSDEFSFMSTPQFELAHCDLDRTHASP